MFWCFIISSVMMFLSFFSFFGATSHYVTYVAYDFLYMPSQDMFGVMFASSNAVEHYLYLSLFFIQLIIMILCIVNVIACFKTIYNYDSEKPCFVITFIICILSLINTAISLSAFSSLREYSLFIVRLGAGPIIYSVINIAAVLISAGGAFNGLYLYVIRRRKKLAKSQEVEK